MAFSWSQLERGFTCLAPMEDVTDTVFRRIVAESARPTVFFTEFTSADGLQSPGRAEVELRLEYSEVERPIVAQIWGVEPENYLLTARELVERGFDGIDINMGCPVEKIIKKGCCGALIADPGRAGEAIAATKEGAQSAEGAAVPVSVKTRIGFATPGAEQWCGFLLEQDIAALTVHGRTVVQQSEGEADWAAIAEVVQLRDVTAPGTVIIGNGDIRTRDQIALYPQQWGVDGTMVGRGIFHDLFIFDRSGEKPLFQSLPVWKKIDALIEHIDLYDSVWGQRRNFHILKKFVKAYIAGFPNAATLRDDLMRSESCNELRTEAVRLRGNAVSPGSHISAGSGPPSTLSKA